MSLYNYVDTPNSNLICCICRTPFTDPTTTLTCLHTFCRECILRALSHAPQCPVDRSPLSVQDLGQANPIVRSLVDEMTVECVHREEGCVHRGQRQLLAIHLREKCRFSEEGKGGRPDKASGQGEGAIEEQAKEERAKGAVEGEVSGNGLAKEKDSAHQPSSPPSSSPATSTATWNIQPTTSQTSYPHTHPRITHLTEQNILLRHRVDTLENAVQVMRKEMDVVRNVLGPWFRNEYVSATSNLHLNSASGSGSAHGGSNLYDVVQATSDNYVGTDEGRLPTQMQAGRSTSGSSSRAGGSTSAGSSEAVEGSSGGVGVDDLASYFPADDEVRVQPQLQTQGSAQASRRGQHRSAHSTGGIGMMDPLVNQMGYMGMGVGFPYQGSYGFAGGYTSSLGGVPSLPSNAGSGASGSTTIASPSATSPLPQPLSSSIPPLATNATLTHCLHALHSDILFVASALDQLAMKSEVGLGGAVGEVLRLGEEVMGVRGSVHGLRMQMHGMLMERGGGMGMMSGFGRTSGSSGEEGGAGGGIQWPSGGAGGPLLNQRVFLPAPGITKL